MSVAGARCARKIGLGMIVAAAAHVMAFLPSQAVPASQQSPPPPPLSTHTHTPRIPRSLLQNMSNTVLAFAKLEFQPGEAVLEGLAREAVAKIQTFSPQARRTLRLRPGSAPLLSQLPSSMC